MRIADAFSKIEFPLPSYPESNVVMKTMIPVYAIQQAQGMDDLEMGIFLAAKLIESWTLEDELTEENIKLLPTADFEEIVNQITPYLQKKSTEKTS